MIDIRVNERIVQVPDALTIRELLVLEKSRLQVAVFVNGQQLRYGEYETTCLHANDVVRILRPLGGG